LNNSIDNALLITRLTHVEGFCTRLAQENGLRLTSIIPMGMEERMAAVETKMDELSTQINVRMNSMQREMQALTARVAETDEIQAQMQAKLQTMAKVVEGVPSVQHLLLGTQRSYMTLEPRVSVAEVGLNALAMQIGCELPTKTLELLHQALDGPTRTVKPDVTSPPKNEYMLRSRSRSAMASPSRDIIPFLNLQ